MAIQKISNDIYSIGVKDWDRKLFDELIPLPHGTTYNSYFIKGSQKNAILDTADPAKSDEYLNNIRSLELKNLDYIISHHAEQDHSGLLPTLLEMHPEAKIVTNQKCSIFLTDLLHIASEKFIIVADGDTLSLGDKTLQFIFTPWVHWPETFCTYLKEDKLLFSCDFFGSHHATSDLFAGNSQTTAVAAKRYYAEIMMPFRTSIKSNLEKLKKLDIQMIAPSHGPIYDKPEFIISAYNNWISDTVKPEVVLPFMSMHGSTRTMVDYLIARLIEKGVTVKPFNLIGMDIGEFAIELVDASTVILASPTVLTGAHPAAVYAAYLINALRPKLKYFGVIGSYGWGGKMAEQITSLTPNLKAEAFKPVIIPGHPKEADFAQLDSLAQEILEKHKLI